MDFVVQLIIVWTVLVIVLDASIDDKRVICNRTDFIDKEIPL